MPSKLNYKVVCISLYREDIARLEELVKQAKLLGYTATSKSDMIRYALRRNVLDELGASNFAIKLAPEKRRSDA